MKMKFWVGLLTGLVLAGCSGGLTINISGVQGSGKMASETRVLENVSQVELAGFGNLTVQFGDKEEITIDAEDNILPLITTEVKGGRLVIGTKPGVSIGMTRGVRYTLTLRKLDTVTLTGSGDIQVQGALDARDVTVRILGSGDITLDEVRSNDLVAEILGSGSIDLRGETQSLRVKISGSGDFSGADLKSASTRAEILGSGDIQLWATDTLDVTITGSGNVEYFGSPTVTQRTPGSGDIIARGEH